MRYPYHGRIKQRIKSGEMSGYHYTEDYPGIGKALVLEFNTEPSQRPIRPHKWHEYDGILLGFKRREGNAKVKERYLG